ncbi:MAG: sigma-70 family RNA polymerase sigma factor [Phycisphaerae bacterium]
MNQATLQSITREEEAALVQRAIANDHSACTTIVTTFGPHLLAVTRRFLRSEPDCHDALQEAFISAFKSLPKFEASSRLSTWLHRITVNACLMKLRSSAARKETSIDELLPTFDWMGHYKKPVPAVTAPDAALEQSETRALVRHAIDQLPDAYRTILLLRDIEELDTAEVARLLDTTENNVKTRLHRARQALRTLLEPLLSPQAATS